MKKRIKQFISDIKYWFSYERCYSDMESQGVAAFGCCHGTVGGNATTEYLSESCIRCPYLVMINKE